jgi:hypothetical protein
LEYLSYFNVCHWKSLVLCSQVTAQPQP